MGNRQRARPDGAAIGDRWLLSDAAAHVSSLVLSVDNWALGPGNAAQPSTAGGTPPSLGGQA